MAYLTLSQLASGPGMLAELAEPFGLVPALLAATVAGGDRSEWTADDRAAADAAVESIQATVLRAESELEGPLATRGYALPLSAMQFPVLTTWCRNIARYHLQPQRDRTNEETGRIERDYRATLRTLDLVATGKLSLGAGDPLAPVTPASADAGAISFTSEPRLFSRRSLRGM